MGVISRLYTFVNGNKAMAQQVNAEFDQLVNAHNSNEGVIASIQTQISTGLATKAELADVTLGLIPDDTITQQKLSPEFRTALPAQYVNNRIPTSADNYAAGHKVGDAWYIPDITLNNLIPTPLAVSPADFIIQNANSAASGSAITLTCQSGFEYALIRRTITPIAGALYCLFASLKLTSDHVLTSIALNDQVITSPVKDTTYNVACVVAEPTQLEVKALAADGATLNGATVVIDKLTIVNMTADMDGVPFDKAGAEAYFQVNPAFLTHEFNNAKTRWYCSDNGVWQSSSQLTPETKALYGVENVDAALKNAHLKHLKEINTTTPSYMLLSANINATANCSAFKPDVFPGRLDNIPSLFGLEIAMLLDDRYSDVTLTNIERIAFASKKSWYEICSDTVTRGAVTRSTSFMAIVNAVPFAKYVYDNYVDCKSKREFLNLVGKESISALKQDSASMMSVLSNALYCSYIRLNSQLEEDFFGVGGSNLKVLTGSGNWTVPVGVSRVYAVLVSAGQGAGANNQGFIHNVSIPVAGGSNIAYSVGTTLGVDTIFNGVSAKTSGALISDNNCTILGRAKTGGSGFGSPGIGGVGPGGGGGGGGGYTNSGARGGDGAFGCGVGGAGGSNAGSGTAGGNGTGIITTGVDSLNWKLTAYDLLKTVRSIVNATFVNANAVGGAGGGGGQGGAGGNGASGALGGAAGGGSNRGGSSGGGGGFGSSGAIGGPNGAPGPGTIVVFW